MKKHPRIVIGQGNDVVTYGQIGRGVFGSYHFMAVSDVFEKWVECRSGATRVPEAV